MFAGSDDPWVMYYVVRKDAPLTLERGMALAGAGAVLCGDRFRDTERWAAWAQRPRKVALRAGAEELDALRAQTDCVAVAAIPLGPPPCRRSDRTPLVGDLKPYTDGPRPKEPLPPPEGP